MVLEVHLDQDEEDAQANKQFLVREEEKDQAVRLG